MTRDEKEKAVEVLKSFKVTGMRSGKTALTEALKMAISSLQTEIKNDQSLPVLTRKIRVEVSEPISICLALSAEDATDYVVHRMAEELAKKLIPHIDISLGHNSNGGWMDQVFEGNIEIVIRPHDTADRILKFFKFLKAEDE